MMRARLASGRGGTPQALPREGSQGQHRKAAKLTDRKKDWLARRQMQQAREARRVERDYEAPDDVAPEHLDDEAQHRVEAEIRHEERPGAAADARAEQQQRSEDRELAEGLVELRGMQAGRVVPAGRHGAHRRHLGERDRAAREDRREASAADLAEAAPGGEAA